MQEVRDMNSFRSSDIPFIPSPAHSHFPPISALLWAPGCRPLWTAFPGLAIGQWEAPADQSVGEQSVLDFALNFPCLPTLVPHLCVEVVPLYKHDFYRAAHHPWSSSHGGPPPSPFRLRSDKWLPTAASHWLLPTVCSVNFDYFALSSHFIKGPRCAFSFLRTLTGTDPRVCKHLTSIEFIRNII